MPVAKRKWELSVPENRCCSHTTQSAAGMGQTPQPHVVHRVHIPSGVAHTPHWGRQNTLEQRALCGTNSPLPSSLLHSVQHVTYIATWVHAQGTSETSSYSTLTFVDGMVEPLLAQTVHSRARRCTATTHERFLFLFCGHFQVPHVLNSNLVPILRVGLGTAW